MAVLALCHAIKVRGEVVRGRDRSMRQRYAKSSGAPFHNDRQKAVSSPRVVSVSRLVQSLIKCSFV